MLSTLWPNRVLSEKSGWVAHVMRGGRKSRSFAAAKASLPRRLLALFDVHFITYEARFIAAAHARLRSPA